MQAAHALCTLHFALCTLHFALCTLHFALCTLHFALCTLYFARSYGSTFVRFYSCTVVRLHLFRSVLSFIASLLHYFFLFPSRRNHPHHPVHILLRFVQIRCHPDFPLSQARNHILIPQFLVQLARLLLRS